MGLFMAKIAHNGELVPGQGNPPGNWLMGHITSHSMGKHYSYQERENAGRSHQEIAKQEVSRESLEVGRKSADSLSKSVESQ